MTAQPIKRLGFLFYKKYFIIYLVVYKFYFIIVSNFKTTLMKKQKFYKVYEVSPLPEFEQGNSLRGIKRFDRYKDAEVFVESPEAADKYNCLTILPVWE